MRDRIDSQRVSKIGKRRGGAWRPGAFDEWVLGGGCGTGEVEGMGEGLVYGRHGVVEATKRINSEVRFVWRTDGGRPMFWRTDV